MLRRVVGKHTALRTEVIAERRAQIVKRTARLIFEIEPDFRRRAPARQMQLITSVCQAEPRDPFMPILQRATCDETTLQ